MGSLKARVAAAVARLRERFGWFDHTVRTITHYGAVNGNAQAGAVTYFGFLSVFPVLALAFFVVGRIAQVYPEAQDSLAREIDTLLPGILGTGAGQIDLSTVEGYAGKVGLVGLVAVLYSGLGWLSGMREALEVMFVVPRSDQPNFLVGKLRDLCTLAILGVTLLLSVAISGAVNGFSGLILDLLGIDPGALVPKILLNLLGHALAIAASAVLLLAMFRLLLLETRVPRRALAEGALLGAVGFEVLKLVANLLLGQTKGSPAFQVFGVALIVVVWINYFSRLVMFAAAWAYTSPWAMEWRNAEAMRAPGVTLTVDDPQTMRPPLRAPLRAPRRRLDGSERMSG